MPLYKQNAKIGALYQGGNKIGRAYRGDTLVYASGTSDWALFQPDNSYAAIPSTIRFAARFVVADGVDADTITTSNTAHSATVGVVVTRDPNFRDTFLVTSTNSAITHNFYFNIADFLSKMSAVDCIRNNDGYGMVSMFKSATSLRYARVREAFADNNGGRTGFFHNCTNLEVVNIDHGFWREAGNQQSIIYFFNNCPKLRYVTSYQNAAHESTTSKLTDTVVWSGSLGNLVRPTTNELYSHGAVGGIDYDLGTVDIRRDLTVTPVTQDHRTAYSGFRFYFEDAESGIESMVIVNMNITNEKGVNIINNGTCAIAASNWYSNWTVDRIYDGSHITGWHADSSDNFRYIQIIPNSGKIHVINMGFNCRWDYKYRTAKRTKLFGRLDNGNWVEISSIKPTNRTWVQDGEYRSFVFPETIA